MVKEVKDEEEEEGEEELRVGTSLRRGGVSITTGTTTGSVAVSGEAMRVRRWSGVAEEEAEGVWILGKSQVRWARLRARRTSCPSAATTSRS